MKTYVAVGSVAWDVVEGDDEARLGGSVLFAARVALAAGWAVRVITSGTERLEDAARAALPGVDLVVQRSEADTVMAFTVEADLGPQAVPTRADPIDLTVVPGLAAADVVHLAPIMGEVTPEVVDAVRGAPFVGITPQGLLRATDPVTHALLRLPQLDPWWASAVDAVVVSEDEHALLTDGTALDEVRLAVTRGERGCSGWHRGECLEVAGVPVGEVSPVGTIGAGDVFASACFIALASGASFAEALEAANRTAASHVAGRPLDVAER